VVASAFYFANWHLISSSFGYFTLLSPPTPLTHTWSLAIEEQFYIVWPLVVIAMMRWRRTPWFLGALAAAGALLSTIEMYYGYHHGWSINRLYYGTDTHAMGLLLGAATACALYGLQRSSGSIDHATTLGRLLRFLGPLSAVGLVLVVYKAYGTSSWMFKGGFTLTALLASVLVAYLVTLPNTVVARGLSVSVMVYIGQISYGLYLWHYPMFQWITSYWTGLSVWPLLVVRLGATFAAAILSYHLLEMPIRRGTWPRGLRQFAVAGLATAVVLGGALIAATAANSTPDVHPPAAATPVNPPKVMLLGDSMMWTLAWALGPYQHAYGVSLSNHSIIGCGLIPSSASKQHQFVFSRYPTCLIQRSGDVAMEQMWTKSILAERPGAIAILAGRWETRDLLFGTHWRNINDPFVKAQLARSMRVIAAAAAHVHAKVTVFTLPCAWDGEQANGAQWVENLPERQAAYNRALIADARSLHEHVFNFGHMVCPNDTLQYYVHGQWIRTADGVHFPVQSAPFFAPRILPYLANLARPSTQPTSGASSR
jgi:peptidoglycan/LPS O-acetylase OafA/YrhL